MAEETKYLYGPVPSRRLGLSLGVDIVPGPCPVIDGKMPTAFKVCTLDCVYCQLGRTSDKTIKRRDYAPIEAVLTELKSTIAQGLKADFITVSGSGEPTLHSRLGQLIDGIKQITNTPAAILTNGTLLCRQDVRQDCGRADVVLPSLDAADQETFQKINRPHRDISIEKVIAGLCTFRSEFAGRIWLEVFLIEGLNTSTAQIAKIKNAIEQIRPDKVHLNTAVRPTAEPGLKRLAPEKLHEIAVQLGPDTEVVADFSPQPRARHIERKAQDVLSMLKRRPCSLNDVCSALGIRQNEAAKYIADLQQQGAVDSTQKNGTTFFKANQTRIDSPR